MYRVQIHKIDLFLFYPTPFMGSRPHMQGTLISLLSQNLNPPRNSSFALIMHLQGTQFKQELPCANRVLICLCSRKQGECFWGREQGKRVGDALVF